MSQRNRHQIIDDTEPTLTCCVCATEFDPRSGDAREYDRATLREGETATQLCICEQDEADFRCDHPEHDQPWDSDTLADDLFDLLDQWSRKAAILAFTESENQVRTIEDVEAFFDALSNLLIWHPDNNFADYMQLGADDYESKLEHDSSSNGCHPDCAACADEEAHKRTFSNEEANALDAVMDRCIDTIEKRKVGKDVYDYAMDAEVRAGRAPKEDEARDASGATADSPLQHVIGTNDRCIYCDCQEKSPAAALACPVPNSKRTKPLPTRGQPVTEEEMAQENADLAKQNAALLAVALELITEASALIPEDANERTLAWHARKASEIPAPKR